MCQFASSQKECDFAKCNVSNFAQLIASRDFNHNQIIQRQGRFSHHNHSIGQNDENNTITGSSIGRDEAGLWSAASEGLGMRLGHNHSGAHHDNNKLQAANGPTEIKLFLLKSFINLLANRTDDYDQVGRAHSIVGHVTNVDYLDLRLWNLIKTRWFSARRSSDMSSIGQASAAIDVPHLNAQVQPIGHLMMQLLTIKLIICGQLIALNWLDNRARSNGRRESGDNYLVLIAQTSLICSFLMMYKLYDKFQTSLCDTFRVSSEQKRSN